MKRIPLVILAMLAYCFSAISPRLIASSPRLLTDDAYYWPGNDTLVATEPVYDKQMREFIFLEDTSQHPDTVRMRILYK